MTDHGSRGHSEWAASATERNWNCQGALALTGSITTPEKENYAAAWGTACHQISERCLRTGVDASDFIGETEKTKEHTFIVDEEMAETAQFFIDYVRGRMADYKREADDHAVLFIEQHFDLTEALKTPFDAGGTGDAVIYFSKWEMIEIVDLKGGRGVVVEVKGNKQLRTYALGALIANAGLAVRKVKSTIVQPRASHKDGRTRDDDYHVADLMEWTAELLEKMKLSAHAKAQFKTMPRAAWAAAYLKAGGHCKFCRAAGFCPAIEQRAMDAAGVWFDDLDQPQISKSNEPDAMTPEQLSKKLDLLDFVMEWVNAVRHYAHELANTGVVIPEYQLSDKIGHRKWKNEDEVRTKLFLDADLTEDDITNRKLKSPAQIEKLLGAKRKHLVEALVERPITGTNLVRVDKTTRPPARAAVDKHFSAID